MTLTLALKFFLRIFVLGIEGREVRKITAPFRMEVMEWNDLFEVIFVFVFFLSFSVLARLILECHLAFSKRVEQL